MQHIPDFQKSSLSGHFCLNILFQNNSVHPISCCSLSKAKYNSRKHQLEEYQSCKFSGIVIIMFT